MSDLSTIIVAGCHYSGDNLDLSGTDFWAFALDQRAFGPRQLMVVTARRDGAVLGLAHCEATEPPELALQCCLAALDDGAPAAVAYSDEPVSADPSIGLRDRLGTARVAARQFGVHLVDWIMCDEVQMRSLRSTLDDRDYWWDASDAGLPSVPPHLADVRNRSPHRLRRPRREPG